MIRYYIYALNAKNQIGQKLVTCEPGKPKKEKWTGKIYNNKEEADDDMIRLME